MSKCNFCILYEPKFLAISSNKLDLIMEINFVSSFFSLDYDKILISERCYRLSTFNKICCPIHYSWWFSDLEFFANSCKNWKCLPLWFFFYSIFFYCLYWPYFGEVSKSANYCHIPSGISKGSCCICLPVAMYMSCFLPLPVLTLTKTHILFFDDMLTPWTFCIIVNQIPRLLYVTWEPLRRTFLFNKVPVELWDL